jgi:hypothetical protein
MRGNINVWREQKGKFCGLRKERNSNIEGNALRDCRSYTHIRSWFSKWHVWVFSLHLTVPMNTDELTRMSSSGMLRRVVLVISDVSEERSAPIIKVTKIGKLGTLAVTSNGRTHRRYAVRPKCQFLREPHGILHSHSREKPQIWARH